MGAGYRDGFDTRDAREDGQEYMGGYARGQADRQAAHERLNEVCQRAREREARLAAAIARQPGARVVLLDSAESQARSEAA